MTLTLEQQAAAESKDQESFSALYYDVATWQTIKQEVPYPFRRLYAIGQSFVTNGKTWVVINAWREPGIYWVLCSDNVPSWIAANLHRVKEVQ